MYRGDLSLPMIAYTEDTLCMMEVIHRTLNLIFSVRVFIYDTLVPYRTSSKEPLHRRGTHASSEEYEGVIE